MPQEKSCIAVTCLSYKLGTFQYKQIILAKLITKKFIGKIQRNS